MLIPVIILIGIFLLGFILFKLSDYYSHKYLGFNTIDHTPVCTQGSTNAPVLVCVLGWGGCTRRHLRRLLEFYSSHDIPTVSWINPMLNYIFGINIKQVERVLDFLLHENRTSNNNIIIHLHSNNGAIIWGYMLDIMKTNEHYKPLLINIKGVILDSAPFIRFNDSSDWLIASAIGTSRAGVSIILNRAQYFHFIWTPLMVYNLFLRFFYRRYLSSDPSSSSEKIKKFLNTAPIQIKQLYIYSDGDRLIPPHIIETFMANQVQRGVTVTSHRFVGSGHVNHFRLFPVEYGKLILDFITNIEK